MLVLLLVIAGGRRVLADRRGRFWIGAAAVGLVLSTGFAEQLMPIPGVRAPARALLWWSLGTATAAALALGRPRSQHDPAVPRGTWLLAAVILGLVIAATTTIGPVARRAAIGSLAVLVVSGGAALLAARRQSGWGSALLVAVLAADLVVLGDALHAGLPRRGIARLRDEFGAIRAALPPPSDEDARGRVIVAPVMPGASWASLEGVRSLQGWNVLVPKVHARLLGTDVPGQYEFGFVADPALLASRSTVLDLLRVRLLVVSSKLAADPRWHDALADPRWRPVRQTASWHFFANDRARPVAWLVHAARAAPVDEVLATVHGRTTPFDPSLEALVAAEIGPLDAATTPEAVDVDRYDDDTVTIRVEASSRALLVTSELAYPGWQATIDGTPVPIHAVDGGLRAVVVRTGASAVVFRYRPLLGRIGLAIGVASAALLACAGILAVRREST